MYLAHLTDYSHLEKSGDFNIENTGIFSEDGKVATSCRGTPVPGRFENLPENLSVSLVIAEPL